MTEATSLHALEPEEFPWFRTTGYSFSLGVARGDWAWLSGHSASRYDPALGRMVVTGGLGEQAETAYAKAEAILAAAGLGWGDVVHVVENLTAEGTAVYPEAVEVRRRVLGAATPAVSTVVVGALLRPAALVEVEVTARRGGGRTGTAPDRVGKPAVRSPAVSADGIVSLPTLLPLDADGQVIAPGDLVGQTEAVLTAAGRLLEGLGLDLSNVVKTLDYTTPATLGSYKATGRVRRSLLGPVWPASAGILMNGLHTPQVLIALEVTASSHPREAVNPGWDRYAKLTYSPAVHAGDVLFLSGQAALDPQTEQAVHPGDVAAQAEYTYGGIEAVLRAAGGSLHDLVRTVEYVTPAGLPRYREVAAVRERVLGRPFPASTGIVCGALLRPEFEIEIDPTAVLGGAR